ncbi:MAG: hypothetical protein IKU84_01150 [Clostridia bacterium]|nr:hypothetical protein [Clostridia bacterium]
MENKWTNIIAFILAIIIVLILNGCFSNDKSDEKETYICGRCGTTMTGAYYDYMVDYSYLCRSCSKALRN